MLKSENMTAHVMGSAQEDIIWEYGSSYMSQNAVCGTKIVKILEIKILEVMQLLVHKQQELRTGESRKQ